MKVPAWDLCSMLCVYNVKVLGLTINCAVFYRLGKGLHGGQIRTETHKYLSCCLYNCRTDNVVETVVTRSHYRINQSILNNRFAKKESA